jgi:hypothetical protein
MSFNNVLITPPPFFTKEALDEIARTIHNFDSFEDKVQENEVASITKTTAELS